MGIRLVLPTGYYAFSIGFTGPQTPLGAAVTGCGENQGLLTASQIATALRTRYVSNILPFQTDDITLSTTYVRLGSNDGTGPAVTQSSASTGASTSTPASPAVAYLIHWYTALGGRRGRGRWFLPGVGEDKVDMGGIVIGSLITSINAALDTFIANLGTDGIPLAIGHRYETDEGPFTALPPTLITDGILDGRAATQRNRQRR